MEAPAPTNVINLSEELGKRIASRLPILQSCGIALSICPYKELEGHLYAVRTTLELVIDSLMGKQRDTMAFSQADFLARRAAVLYRCVGQLAEAEKQSAKLGRKLHKAKKKAKAAKGGGR